VLGALGDVGARGEELRALGEFTSSLVGDATTGARGEVLGALGVVGAFGFFSVTGALGDVATGALGDRATGAARGDLV
jgi:hypothetical protein